MRNHTFISTLVLLAIVTTSVVGEDVHFTGEIKLPAIARHQQLLNRMMEELKVAPPKVVRELPEGTIAFFQKLLVDGTEADLQLDAVRALGEIAQENDGDISPAFPAITALLTHQNRELRRAAALTLIAADAKDSAAELLKLCESSDGRLRSIVEPVLGKWEFQPAAAMWNARLQDPSSSGSSLTLAANGLSTLESTTAADAVRAVIENQNAPYRARHAAGVALSSLDAGGANEVAAKLAVGTLRDRLLAVVLLNNKNPESLNSLATLCSDKENAVAAKAWTQLSKLDSSRLKQSVAVGCDHPDSGVRRAAVRVMSDFPEAAHCDLLAKLSGDVHINVRNEARVVLLEHATTDAELQKQIVANAEAAVKANDSWERTEQALLIAALLNQTQFTAMCVPLLEHERPEVFVTAAWIMHLYPDALVMDAVTPIMKRRYELRNTRGLADDIDLQMSFLFQTAGWLEHKPVQSLCEAQFSKNSGLGWAGRAAGISAIGMMNRDNPEADLVQKIVGRLNDRDSMVPELGQVQRMAVMSIGRMGAKDQISELMKAHGLDPVMSVIPESARWAMTRLGETNLPARRSVPNVMRPVGGWNVYPVSKRK
jgi:HEAT repeat protein